MIIDSIAAEIIYTDLVNLNYIISYYDSARFVMAEKEKGYEKQLLQKQDSIKYIESFYSEKLVESKKENSKMKKITIGALILLTLKIIF